MFDIQYKQDVRSSSNKWEVNAVGNITFGSFIAEKRKAHKFNLRDTAKHLNIAYGYLCDIEQSRRPAPNGDFVERISAFLNLDCLLYTSRCV